MHRLLIDKSIVIHARPERVFEWLNPTRMKRWDHSLVRAASAEALASGATFDMVTRPLGFRLQTAAEAVAVEPGRVFAWRQLHGDYERHRGAYMLEAVPGGTRVRLVAEIDLPYVLPRLVTEAEVRRGLSRDCDDALYNLKELIERQAFTSAS